MAEKPLECTQCSKAVCVTYKEITKGTCTNIGMCANCPMLAKKLYGESKTTAQQDRAPQLYCAHCLTTFESLQIGGEVGCNQCYAVFEKPLLQKLIKEKLLPPYLNEELSDSPIHRGKSPHRLHPMAPAYQLTTLNEALNEALEKEQYEQAAWLRDQIKEWKEKISESS